MHQIYCTSCEFWCFFGLILSYSFFLLSADLEITVPMLVQIDKLVQLIESPVFTCKCLETDSLVYSIDHFLQISVSNFWNLNDTLTFSNACMDCSCCYLKALLLFLYATGWTLSTLPASFILLPSRESACLFSVVFYSYQPLSVRSALYLVAQS